MLVTHCQMKECEHGFLSKKSGPFYRRQYGHIFVLLKRGVRVTSINLGKHFV